MTADTADSGARARSSAPAPTEGDGTQGSEPVTEFLIAIALVAVGVGFALRGLQLGVNLGDTTSAGLAPFVFGLALVLPATALVLGSRRQVQGRGVGARVQREGASFARLRGPALGLAAITGYTLLLPRLGYLLATFVFALALLFLLGWRGVRGLVAAALLTALVFCLFSVALRVPLPPGPLL